MNYMSSSQLKALAREKLKGNYGILIGAFVIVSAVSLIASFIASFFYRNNNMYSFVIYYLITIIISLLETVLSVGLTKMFLNFTRDKKFQISDLLWGFKNHPDKIIVSTILLILIYLVLFIPSTLVIIGAVITNNNILFVLAVLITLATVIVTIVVSLSYSLVYYLLADGTANSAIAALKLSRQMMKGHKARFFYINISFVGILLLSIFSCYIGLLWVCPYILATETLFYIELQNKFNNSSSSTEYYV